jgi:hypothetical protein
VRTAESNGAAPWSGLGLTLTLPPGHWRIESRGENAVLFTPKTGAGSLLIERVKPSPQEPDWLAMDKLLSSFEKKKELSRLTVHLPEGDSALCAEYGVQVDGASTLLRAYVLRRAGWIYEFAEWNFGRGTLAEDFLAGLAPASEPSPAPRAP